MAKARNSATFSETFRIDPGELDRLGVLDPTLAIDTKLFIDPLLFGQSAHAEIHTAAVKEYRAHFELVIRCLAASRQRDDVAWRAARRLLQFHEIGGTCLGYGAGSIHGSGFGTDLTERLLRTGKEIVELGIRDPDLFPVMSLLEARIGSDRVSDMATNAAFSALAAFNARVLAALGLEAEDFEIGDKRGSFVRNPLQTRRTPVILVPRDILRALPIAHDWDGVASAASHNESLRRRVSAHITHIWAVREKRDREVLRRQALASREAFATLLDAVHEVPTEPYDVEGDPAGLATWARVAARYVAQHPLALTGPATSETEIDYVHRVVGEIVTHFRQLVENNGLNKVLYAGGRPRSESIAQRVFFGIADAYCRANDVDIAPEIDVGTGKIDFQFSRGYRSRVILEVKLSSNGKLVAAYTTQLGAYKDAQQTTRAIYLVIDVGGMGKKDDALVAARNAAAARGDPVSELEFVDARPRPPASKR